MFGIGTLKRLLENEFEDYFAPERDFEVGDEVVYTAPSGKTYDAIFVHMDEGDNMVFIRYWVHRIGWLTGWVSLASLTPNAPAVASAS